LNQQIKEYLANPEAFAAAAAPAAAAADSGGGGGAAPEAAPAESEEESDGDMVSADLSSPTPAFTIHDPAFVLRAVFDPVCVPSAGGNPSLTNVLFHSDLRFPSLVYDGSGWDAF